MSFHTYWGKSGHRPHLLAYHCLDVAACGLVLLDRLPSFEERFDEALGGGPGFARRLLPGLLALHDVGKFSPSFQRLEAEHFAALQPDRRWDLRYGPRHDLMGMALWDTDLRDLYLERSGLRVTGSDFAWDDTYELLLQPIMGHHGKPIPLSKLNDARMHFDAPDRAAASAFLTAAFEVDPLRPPAQWPDLFELDEPPLHRITWLIAGWASLADWLGSNEHVFEKIDDAMPLGEYWERFALPGAHRSVERSGVVAPARAQGVGFDNLFDGWSHTPMQRWANEVEIDDRPALVIIEDATGSGKTEAALTFAQRKLAGEGASGVYIGLPTMATANGMYPRLAERYRRFFDDGAQASLVLAHGARGLHDDFQSTVLRDYQGGSLDALLDDDAPSQAVCASWVANSTKVALLAPFGVGTIDQAMLAVLPAKYQAMRMVGLAQKILVVDEVHAYDDYMAEIIGRLLEFMAGVGRSVVLLSATLPQATRRRFVDAWCRGAGAGPQGELTSDAYPLVTTVAGVQVEEHPVAPVPGRDRTIPVDYQPDPELVHRSVVEHARAGRCVCWIRNTVDDATTSFDALQRDLGERVTLFHARFAMCDRQRIEADVLRRFGKIDRPDAAHGHVVVATQVVEQSLDLDFDVVVTDLAPIDLVLQRAGRMRRHARDRDGRRIDGADERPAWPLIVHGPAFDTDPPPRWYGSLFEKGQHVYPDAGHLWRTARELVRRERLQIPGDSRDLVEAVYGAPDDEVPAGIAADAERVAGERAAMRSSGRFSSLKLDAGYCVAANPLTWRHEAKVSTRLGEPTTTLRLGLIRGGEVRPLADVDRHGWELSEVRISSRKAEKQVLPASLEAVAARTTEAMRDKGRYSELVLLEQGDDGLRATVTGSDGRTRRLNYDPRYGLRLDEDHPSETP